MLFYVILFWSIEAWKLISFTLSSLYSCLSSHFPTVPRLTSAITFFQVLPTPSFMSFFSCLHLNWRYFFCVVLAQTGLIGSAGKVSCTHLWWSQSWRNPHQTWDSGKVKVLGFCWLGPWANRLLRDICCWHLCTGKVKYAIFETIILWFSHDQHENTSFVQNVVLSD